MLRYNKHRFLKKFRAIITFHKRAKILLYKRNIPETDQSTFIAFVTNSLSLSGVFINHIQVRQNLAKPIGERHSWIQSHIEVIDKSWNWIMKRELIQCPEFLQWFIQLNSDLMARPCSTEKDTGKFKKSELGKLRRSPTGGNEITKILFDDVAEYIESIFSVLEKNDNEKDKDIMPKRLRFNSAVELAKIAWKVQFQIGYICPFFQGNWVSARLLTNILRVHWSLPWLTFEYPDEDKEAVGQTYQLEVSRWFDLFDEHGVLTDKFLSY